MKPEKLPCIHLYPGDWLRDDVAGCSLAAQGLWLRMMFVAHSSERYGYLGKNGSPIPPAVIAQRCGVDLAQYETLLRELLDAGIPSCTPNGIFFSRRMVRDAKLRKDAKKNGRKGGNPNLLRQGVNPPDKPDLKVNTEIEDWFPEKFRTREFQNAWSAWLRHRQQMGEPPTQTAMEEQIKRLSALPVETAIAAIQTSVANGYAGVVVPANGTKHHHNTEAKNEKVSRLLAERQRK